MADSSAQSIFTSPLLQRLESRTAPGVVNVRRLLPSFNSMPPWIVQRSQLLNQLQQRYSQYNNTSSTGAELLLVAPGRQLPQENAPSLQVNDAGISRAVARATVSPNLQTSGESDSVKKIPLSRPVEEQGGRGENLVPNSSQSTSVSTSEMLAGRLDTLTNSDTTAKYRVSRQAKPGTRVDKMTATQINLGSFSSQSEQPTVSSETLPLSQKKATDTFETSAENSNQLPVVPEYPPKVENFSPSAPLGESFPSSIERQTVSSQMPLSQKKATDTSETSAENSNQLPIVSEYLPKVENFSSSAPLILPRRDVMADTSSNAAANPVSSGVVATTITKTTATSEKSLHNPDVLSRTQTKLPLVKSANIQRSLAEVSPRQYHPPVAIASTISVNGAASLQPQMVWRKSANTSSENFPFAFTGGRQNSSPMNDNGYTTRQQSSSSNSQLFRASTTENTISRSIEIMPTETEVQTIVQQVDVRGVAEQVSRILSRQLTVERERRGINLWY